MKLIKSKKAETKEKNPKSVNESISLKIPTFFGSDKTIIFHNDFLEYENQKIFYSDITGISYTATRTKTSVYFIPVSDKTSYKLKLISNKTEISISFSENEELFNKMINISKYLIEPLLVQRIVKKIFEENVYCTIGNIDFNRKGYSKQKFFGLGKIDQVLWSDPIYVPKYYKGQVILFKDTEGKGKIFEQIPMSEENSVILPELVQACVTLYQYLKNNQKGDINT